MAAMETQEPDDLTDYEDVADHRDRARNLLPQITQQVRQALNDADIDLDVFLMIPASGDAVATFGTIADPDDELWKRVTEIVSSVVRRTVGLDRVRCRLVVCATTHDHQSLQSSVQSAGLSGCRSLPTSALQPSGATR
jgi:hypothetical protein